MDRNAAAFLLINMLERLESAGQSATLTTHEKAALRVAIQTLSPDAAGTAPPEVAEKVAQTAAVQSSAAEPTEVRRVLVLKRRQLVPDPLVGQLLSEASPEGASLQKEEEDVVLNLASLQRTEPSVSGAMLCLDFGTAMSKAFAGIGASTHLHLALGIAAGDSGYMLPSTMFIGDDGRLYFGREALDKSEHLPATKRRRLDSIKSRLSQRKDLMADVDTTLLTLEENPDADLHLTHGDMIRLYLAYFTDVAELALAQHEAFRGEAARYVERRYARPCWPDADQERMADAKMREMMEHAQILADTFSGQWSGGVPLRKLKLALRKVRDLGARPNYLVKSGIPEPVAVAAGVVYDSENVRDAYMVVDVGAGTTDFGLFVATRRGEAVKMHQNASSIQGVMQAGDKVDSLLRAYIAHHEGIDSADAHGSEVMADLARRVRPLKELLFRTGELEYTLSDGTVGKVQKKDFLANEKVQAFSKAMEAAFVKALAAVSDSWLQWLSTPPMHLKVVVTGGSASLDMMQALSRGLVDVRGYKIMRVPIDARPDWMDTAAQPLRDVYPQLAVAIGGTSDEMPDVLVAPPELKR